MPTFGDYETVGEPAATSDQRGHVSNVWQGRKSSARDGRLYAIKCYAPRCLNPKAGQTEGALAEGRALEFLEGIKQLKKAHSEGCCHLAPIHAFGIADTGAWYVTDFYPRDTLKAWIARRGSVDSAALQHVVYSVVTGCLALKRSRGYSHGNLKSSNVFLVGKPRLLRHTPLHLADPYPAAPSRLSRLEDDDRHEPGELNDKVIEARDLRAIGELIFELVEGRLSQSGGDDDYPVYPSLAWGRLGKDRTRWRLLCNRLLDPRLSLDKVNLESLAKEFRPNPVLANLPMILTMLGSICLLAAGSFYGTELILKGGAERKVERERQFGEATNAGWVAYRAGNWTHAIAEADKALAIHSDDVGMKKLKTDALAQRAERERQFGVARNAAWAAYRVGNWTNAIVEADKALAIHGDDAGMKKLKALGQETAVAEQVERERQFGVATNVAWVAYHVGNLTIAIAEADKALAIHGDDAGMKKLKTDALSQQTSAVQQDQRKGQSGGATNAGWAAYRAGNWTNVIAETDKALAIHSDDAGIKKLNADALARRIAAVQQAERERQFGEATNEAWAAYRAGNLTNAIAEADKALAIHGDDVGIKKLKADALARLAFTGVNEQQPGTPPPPDNVSGPEQPELAKLDTTLETYEVLFRLKPPAPNIVSKNGTQLKPLPLTLIPLDQKAEILKTLKVLESGYQANGWLQQRKQRLQSLRGKIKDW